MNLYVHIMNNVIEHIEESINEQLTLQNVSQQFYLSEFHFSRLFKIVTGLSLKQYILGRKLALATEKLKDPQKTVTDIAYELGFEYPEVFSRNFKKWFGVAPTVYRAGYNSTIPMPKALVVERDIINFKGVLALKETYVYRDAMDLYGFFIEVDENASNFDYTLKSAGENFLTDKRYTDNLEADCFYSVVNCHGDDSGKYTVFFGGQAKNVNDNCLDIRNIPAGWYASFSYHGEILDMRTTFDNDFYRWILIKEVEPCPNGIGMLNIYDRLDIQNVRVLVPVKEPK